MLKSEDDLELKEYKIEIWQYHTITFISFSYTMILPNLYFVFF